MEVIHGISHKNSSIPYSHKIKVHENMSKDKIKGEQRISESKVLDSEITNLAHTATLIFPNGKDNPHDMIMTALEERCHYNS